MHSHTTASDTTASHTTASHTTAYRLRPLSATAAAELRRVGGKTYIADNTPGYPCRQCLRDADVGDELILVSHDPFRIDTPYRSASPVFVHAHDCADRLDDAALPRQLGCRRLSVRAFDGDQLMTDAAVIDGAGLDVTLTTFFDDPAVQTVHIHNAERGCWAVTAERST